MANKRLFDLPQTRGSFQIRGHVNGVERQNFYTEKTTKNGNLFRRVNFGTSYEKDKTVYLSLNGMPREFVYYSKRDKESGKIDTQKVRWEDRYKFNSEGYRMIGVNVGLQQIRNENGSVSNVIKTLAEFDACEYLKAYLEDEMSIFASGNLEFSSYTTDTGEIRRQTSFTPAKIYASKGAIDFDADNYKPQNTFVQNIVYRNVQEEIEDDKATGRYILSAYIVNYNSIEPVEFIIKDKALASSCKKYMKPYWMFEVNGRIEVEHFATDVVSVASPWGTPNPNKRLEHSSKTEMVITGVECDESTKEPIIDKETYTEKNINAAFAAIQNANHAESNFGEPEKSTVNWGTDADSDVDEDIPW